MTFKIKLKVGFFKTKPYELSVNKGQIALIPLEENENVILINNSELQSVNFITKDIRGGEIEIITKDDIYIGSLVVSNEFKELEKVLSKELGHKIILHKSVLD